MSGQFRGGPVGPGASGAVTDVGMLSPAADEKRHKTICFVRRADHSVCRNPLFFYLSDVATALRQ